MSHLFVYGTLMSREILTSVLRQSSLVKCDMKSAILMGYQRYAVMNENYPAIIEKEKDSVQGYLIDLEELWTHLDHSTYESMDQVLRRLDEYEGEEYERILVKVKSCQETEVISYTFQWIGDEKKLIKM